MNVAVSVPPSDPDRFTRTSFPENRKSCLVVALVSAWKWKARTGMTLGQMLKTFFGALREGDGAIQTLMAANAPVLIQRAMVEGRPDEGVLPAGQVAAVIDDLPTVKVLVERIVAEATERLTAVSFPLPLAGEGGPKGRERAA